MDKDREGVANEGRRRILKRIIGAAAIGIGGGEAAYARYIAPYHPVLENVTVFVRNLPPAFEGVRVAQLSDLHIQAGFPAACLEPALQLVRVTKPDLIVLNGDYQNDRAHHGDNEMRACAAALHGLSTLAPLGAYAVYGNHDYPPPPAQPDEGMWRAVGITPLRNRAVELIRGGERIFLVGLDSILSRYSSPFPTLSRLPKTACSLVVWHEPDWAEQAAAAGAALQLSGHTHGGQVVLPGVGAPVLPIYGRLYPSGLFHVRGMPLYVTRGVGLLPPLVRVNCPPEVTLLTLRRADGTEKLVEPRTS